MSDPLHKDNADAEPSPDSSEKGGAFPWIKRLLPSKPEDHNLREALEDYIEELDESDSHSVAVHERNLISNVLKIRNMTLVDVMIPRADIAAIEVNASEEDLMALLSEKQFSRIPVYRETLDDVIGSVHIKDIMACMAAKKELNIRNMLRDIPVLSPAMAVLDLLLLMQEQKKHMALVTDEYGGIDGLVTIGDIIEAIVGEVEDEFDTDDQPELIEKPDGTLLADARYDLEEFEEKYGCLLKEEEREDADTIGGLVFLAAGRVPARGEVIRHESSGMVFEIVDADPRRVERVLIKNIPKKDEG
ncbi:MAG: HlyC/CorC family transporter [Rhodospirillales bacterium]|nr:HlyC/CorC family transporter [Alphaproteobacteria bacterium]USO03382.1 MAG: HlyC/CorC family transporter [Rhodospirillales bacterium]